LKSTRPSAPAWSSRSAISPTELKCGPSLTATRHGHRVFDPAQDVDVPPLDLAAWSAGSPGYLER
jgi:hypothetical protein